MSFILDPKLEADSDFICELRLSQVRWSKNAAFPWLILIPQQPDMVEILDLKPIDQNCLFQEIVKASYVMKNLFHPHKLNVAALGNVVAQLHVHVIARFRDDKAWPNPVWNSGVFTDYSLDEKENRIRRLKAAFKDNA